MSELPHTFRYTIGDWSDDGHGKTSVHKIRSNHTMKEIAVAYKASVKKTGVSFIDEVASDYQSRDMPAQKFLDAGMDRDKVCWENDPDDDPVLWTCGYTDHYILLLTEFCKLSLPDLVMEDDPNTRQDDLCYAFGHGTMTSHHGYGLFD